MSGICEGRVAIVTGAGRGLGREHALELARQGAAVVVNDLGAELDGRGNSTGPAQEVVDIIRSHGGQAEANGADVADFSQAQAMVQQAIESFGRLDILVNNAGFVRDRMIVSATEEDWDPVIRVHLKGHFAPLHHASSYWREEAKAGRTPVARVINTSSGAGLQGSVGQAAYSAAKGGIASMTLVASHELARYGVTVNAIAPSARTRMTSEVFADQMAAPDDGFDAMDPANVSTLVAWLASPLSGGVTGRVVEIGGGHLCLETGWRHGPSIDIGRRFKAEEVGDVLSKLIAEAPIPEQVYGA